MLETLRQQQQLLEAQRAQQEAKQAQQNDFESQRAQRARSPAQRLPSRRGSPDVMAPRASADAQAVADADEDAEVSRLTHCSVGKAAEGDCCGPWLRIHRLASMTGPSSRRPQLPGLHAITALPCHVTAFVLPAEPCTVIGAAVQ